ncbi:DUF6290 family protein [Streptococcus sp. ZJ93]
MASLRIWTVPLSINLHENEWNLFKIRLTWQSLSSLFKEALECDIKNEYDLKIYHQA